VSFPDCVYTIEEINMSRTLRLGKPSRNYHYYLKMSVIWGPAEVSPYNGEPYWIEDRNNPGSYNDYVRREVRKHHRDKGGRNVPNFCRKLDVKIQAREHRLAIHNGLRSADLDICLNRLQMRNSYNWW
jgi:hypothetical protein